MSVDLFFRINEIISDIIYKYIYFFQIKTGGVHTITGFYNRKTNYFDVLQSKNKLFRRFTIEKQIITVGESSPFNYFDVLQSKNKLFRRFTIEKQIITALSRCFDSYEHWSNNDSIRYNSKNKLFRRFTIEKQIISTFYNRKTNYNSTIEGFGLV